MDSVFEIIGPPMVGPSSSHTAGACRLGLAARAILAETPAHAQIGLHGSFWSTGQGHGTDQAIISGLLNRRPEDDRLKSAFEDAKQEHLTFSFEQIDLGLNAHPNSVKITLTSHPDSESKETPHSIQMLGSSTGGGSILIWEIDSFSVNWNGTLDALILWHQDEVGFLSRVTTVLACADANIASIRTSRLHRGENALTLIELDAPLRPEVINFLPILQSVQKAHYLPSLTRSK